jgi:hypothetical protein
LGVSSAPARQPSPGEVAYWKHLADNATTPEDRSTIEHNRAELAEYSEHFWKHYFLSCWNIAADENVAMWGNAYTSGSESVASARAKAVLQNQLHPASRTLEW